MKRAITTLLAATALSASLPALASAQNFVDARQSGVMQRIDTGERNGAITRNEASRLRAEFNAIVRLEVDYRRGGLSQWERRDLQDRLQDLSRRVRVERNDRQRSNSQFDRRADNIQRQIDQGLRGGGLTRQEASRLNAELQTVVRLERQYSRNGLTQWERREVNRRFDGLANRVYAERRDNQQQYGYGYGYGGGYRY